MLLLASLQTPERSPYKKQKERSPYQKEEEEGRRIGATVSRLRVGFARACANGRTLTSASSGLASRAQMLQTSGLSHSWLAL